MAVCYNLVPLVNIKIAGKWMFIPLKMVLVGIDPYPYESFKFHRSFCCLTDRMISDGSSPDPHLLGGAGWRERHINVGLGQLLGKLIGLWMFMAQTSLELNILS